MYSCKWFLFECLKMFSEANHLWTAINLDPGITCTICRPAGLIYCWWILFSTFQTLYCVKCHIKLSRGTLRVVSFISFILCFTNVTQLYCYCHPVRSFVIWLVPRAGKMNQIACRDWLPERARWSHVARSGLPAVSCKQNFPKSHIINPYWPSLFSQDGWMLASFFFSEFMDLDFVSVHKHARKELGQYPAIFSEHLVNNPYLLHL